MIFNYGRIDLLLDYLFELFLGFLERLILADELIDVVRDQIIFEKGSLLEAAQ